MIFYNMAASSVLIPAGVLPVNLQRISLEIFGIDLLCLCLYVMYVYMYMFVYVFT